MSYTLTEWESTDVVTATRMNALEQAVGDMNMSYTPNVWSDGDILSAEKMNALEQAVASGGGGSSAPLICTEADGYLDKTFGELRTALLNGVTIIVQKTDDMGEFGTAVYIDSLASITYTIAADAEYSTAYGDISCHSLSYTVVLEEAPYTIEALDALYPRVPS